MKRVRRYLEKLRNQEIRQNNDRVIIVLGDEGVGKSTFILQIMILWKAIQNRSADADDFIDQLTWTRPEFRRAIANYRKESVVPAMDATRVLHRKEAMHGDQIDLEKDFLDIRVRRHVIVLGFQEWRFVPSFLAERRAQNVFHIPKRGLVRGYNRASIDERVSTHSWPEADLLDVFPPMDGHPLWEQFREIDEQKKQERILQFQADEEEEVDEGEVRHEEREEIARRLRKHTDLTVERIADAVNMSAGWVSKRTRGVKAEA